MSTFNETKINLQADKQRVINEYESNKKTILGSNLIDLPSKGLYYPLDHPFRSGKANMRYMTAFEEDIMTNQTYIKNGESINKLIESLLIEDVPIDTILQCDKDALIIAARVFSYGKVYNVTVNNPTTNKPTSQTIDLTKIDITTPDVTIVDDKYFSYLVPEFENFKARKFKLRFIDIGTHKKVISSEKPLFDFIKYSTIAIDDETNPDKIEEILKFEIPSIQTRQVREYILNNMPRIKTVYEFEDGNGGVFKAGFQIGSDFFPL